MYSDKDYTVIKDNISNSLLKKQIKSHDRILMLGHGTEYGLLGYKRLVVDSKLVYLLRDKLCISVWCNANKFVNKYGLCGFNTGMIISEYAEAIDCGVDTNPSDILYSNILFAKALNFSIDSNDMLADMYSIYTGDTSVILFNSKNLFSNDK